jgi:CheY-like chemotaxis protein
MNIVNRASPLKPASRKTMLYIEDNPLNATVVRAMLNAKRPELILTVCETGAAALEHLRREKPDFLLIDIYLPDTNGLELLNAIRRDPARRDIPAIATSASMPASEVKNLLANGFAHFLQKPINSASLLQLLG